MRRPRGWLAAWVMTAAATAWAEGSGTFPEHVRAPSLTILAQLAAEEIPPTEAAELLRDVWGSYCPPGYCKEGETERSDGIRRLQTPASVKSLTEYFQRNRLLRNIEPLKRGMKEWLAAVEDDDPVERMAAVRWLREAKGPEARRAVLRSLEDDAVLVRYWAVRALGEPEDEPACSALADRLDDPAMVVRLRVVRALKGRKEPRIVEALRELGKDDPEESVRRAARAAVEADRLKGGAKP